MRRILLFLATNMLVLVTISLIINILGIKPYITEAGVNYGSLMAFCLVWGMAGSFISLAMSRVIAKWTMGVQIIASNNREFGDIVETVHIAARKAGLSIMPEVGVYENDEVNAFATGPSKNRSLVAVSTGLLEKMDERQVAGVLGHEVAHIANGDMVTMTLVQGVINAFVMFFARIAVIAIGSLTRQELRGGAKFMLIMLFEVLFGILGMFVVCWFSRFREFRADAGGAKLMGKSSMVAALQRLAQMQNSRLEPTGNHASLNTMKISGKKSRFMALLSTHPPLEERIERLQNKE